jgi:two-component system phosphate regulon sensor histidine kinase PhoR
MRLRGVLFAAAAMAAVPLAVLLLLVVSGAAEVVPVLLGMAAVSTAAVGLGQLWRRDLARVVQALRGAAGVPTRPRVSQLPMLTAFAAEMEQLHRTQSGAIALAEEKQRAEQAILEGLPDPLVILDADLRVHRTNMAARREFGTEAAAVLRHPTLRAAIDRALAEGASQTAELALPVPMPRELQATVTLLDPAPGGGRVMVLLADRSRERAVERMRADFVANAGHELRTPLTSLIGFIDTLRGPAADDPAAQRRFLGIMAEQAARMHRLIDDLLSLSRIELVEHQRPTGRVDLAELARQVVAGLEPALKMRKVALTVQIDPALPRVTGDADQLAQVLQNLLENARKYGGEGVNVRLAAIPARSGERWPVQPGVVLTVADTGPGIAPEHLPRLTERFYRVDTGRSRAAGGTGLGLAIVKHIVNRHRGQLRIESKVGAGTSFSIWLPTS